MILITTYPDEASKTQDNVCHWVAETEIDGIFYQCKSRHGATNELARILINAGIPDTSIETRIGDIADLGWGRPGMRLLSHPSFHIAAKFTYSEGKTASLHRQTWLPMTSIFTRDTHCTAKNEEEAIATSSMAATPIHTQKKPVFERLA
jgi:hypothetical protein